MQYFQEFTLRNGAKAVLRSAAEADAAEVLAVFNQAHSETDFLLTYPDENSFTAETEAAFLKEKYESDREIEIIAVVDGRIAGSAGFEAVGSRAKVLHRADFGISILREYWGCGLGRLLTEACIDCARQAGYELLELTVVADNARAVSLYKKLGFTEFGRYAKAFKSRLNGYQELVYMALEL